MPKTKASLLVIAATAVTVVTLFLLPFTPRTAVRTAVVERGELICSTLLEGVVAYADEQPLIALQAGRVGKVYVRQGQTVRAGELLISMDTDVLEQELAAVNQLLYEQETALAAFGQAGEAALSAAQTALQARTRQAELRASIASAQIRAEADGVVGALYVAEGAIAGEGGLLGSIHGTGLPGIVAAGRGGGTGKCSARSGCDGDQRGRKNAGRRRSGAVGSTGTGQQHRTGDAVAFFFAMDDGAWMGVGAGDRVVVELVQEALEDQALVPISAVDSRDRVWFVEDGIATPVEIDLTLRNDAYVAVPQEWAGKRVVLLPETASLYPGAPSRRPERGEAVRFLKLSLLNILPRPPAPC